MAQSGFTPILTYASNTASAVPLAGNLANSASGAELAVNTADKRLFVKNSGGTVVELGTNPSSLTLNGLSASQAVFTDGSKNLVSNAVTGTGNVVMSASPTLTGTVAGASLQLSSLTSGRVTYAGASGLLQDSTNLTFDGTSLTLGGNPTLSAGTANGVLYLNGSKVATSGTDLVFNATGLGIGTSSPLVKFDVKGATDTHVGITASGVDEALILAYDDVGVRTPNLSYAAASHKFLIAGDEKMRLDSSGNLGLGVTPGTWAASAKAIEFAYPAYGMAANGGAFASFNARESSGSNWVYKSTDEASRLELNPDGSFRFYTAPSGTAGNTISFTQAMTLDASGQLGIGTTSPQRSLHINGSVGAMRLQGSSVGGYIEIVGPTTTNYIGTPAAIASGSTTDLGFYLNGSERMRIDTSGNLGLGVTPSAWLSSARVLQMAGNGVVASASNYVYLGANVFYDSSGITKYIDPASTPASMYSHGGGAHAWFTAPSGTAGNTISFTQAMTLSAAGGLSVGNTTDPGVYTLSVGPRDTSGNDGVIRIDGGSGASGEAILILARNGASDFLLTSNSTLNEVRGVTNVPLAFRTNDTERARITSGGDLLVGTTSSIFTSGVGGGIDTLSSAVAAGFTTTASAAINAAGIWHKATTGDNTFIDFGTEGSYIERGSIDYNRAGGLVRYNTTSDYRAKDIIGPVQNPGATIDALKVYEGVMKGATQSRPMLIAHEAQEHAPYAVSGVKDEVNEDGTPKFQQIDVSSLVPLLLAEIQSLRARVAALEAQP